MAEQNGPVGTVAGRAPGCHPTPRPRLRSVLLAVGAAMMLAGCAAVPVSEASPGPAASTPGTATVHISGEAVGWAGTGSR